MSILGQISALMTACCRKTGLALLVASALAGTASAGDLQVTSYQVTDPVADIYNGADVTLKVEVDNNTAVPVTDAVVTINVAQTMIVSAGNVPGICSADGFTAPQTLTCNLPTLTQDGSNPDYTFSFIATASTANALSSTATISSVSTSDSNAANDALTITPTVSSGADLSVMAAASVASLPAGTRFNYTYTTTNNGPDAVSEVTVSIALPPSSDFGYVSATGSNWNCTYSGGASQSASCDYTGPAIASGNNFPVITVTGDADAQSGTLSSQGDAAVTGLGIGDPNASNNTSNTASVTITPGTDLAAGITIPPAIITGDTVTLNLRITNNGPTAIGAGATITHSLDPNFTINGPLPGGCAFAAPVISCTAGALSDGGVENFPISLDANSDSSGNVVISATVTPPVGINDGASGNDTANDTFRIDDPAADVFMQYKGKSPNPVQAGGTITSTIRIENGGPSVLNWTPANPVTITDDLQADETYSSLITANWSCSTGASAEPGYATRVTCVTTDSGSLAVNARKTVQITTVAGGAADGTLTNRACVDETSLSLVDTDTSNNCRTRGTRATTETANLSLTAEVSLTDPGGYSPAITQPAANSSHYIRLTVTNAAGSDTARTVNINTSNLANWLNATVNYNGGSAVHKTDVQLLPSPGFTCSVLATSNDNIACTTANLLAGESRTMVLYVSRALLDGPRTTTFTVTSPDTIESDTSDDSDSVTVDAEPNTDLIVNDKQINPDPLSSGGVGKYIISVKNIGANTGDGVTLTDPIDAARFDVLGVTTTAPGGTCDYGTTTAGTVTCTMGSLNRGQTYQVTAQIRPKYPFNGATNPGDFPAAHTNTASVSTTTYETDAANNSRSLMHNVAAPNLDLQVTNAEPASFSEPGFYPDALQYEVRTRNSGATLGTGIVTTVTPNPAAGYEMAYNAGLSTIPAGVSCSQASNTAPVICSMPDMATGEERTPVLVFDIVDAGGGSPAGPVTFGTTAVVTSDQDGFDTPTGNNTAAQTTTVIPRTDLEVVSKTLVSATPINIAEPVIYDIVFRNNGGSDTTQVRLTDTLPAGFSITATPVTFTASGAANVTGNSCSGTTTILCVVDGLFPADGSTITMQIEAAADFPFTGNLANPIVNSVSIDVGQTAGGAPLSVDEVPGNNTRSASSGVLRVSSIAGRVYADDDQSGAFNGAEGLGGVTLTLTGTDLYGNAIPAATTAITNPDGSYSFTGLPPSNAGGYTITETQPAGYSDFNEAGGSSGGVVDNTGYDTAAAHNRISSIVLNEGIDATGYEFAEYSYADLSGRIYDDADNNGVFGGSDSGIGGAYSSPTQISLTGTDYAGNAVTLAVPVDGSGNYTIANVPPSDGSGYTVAQTEEPSGYLDGLEENGAGNVVAGSVNSTEAIVLGTVGPGASLTERNFGHIQNSSLAGVVWVDTNGNATREGSESGRLENAIVELTGTNDLGAAISCSFTTAADGAYSFPVVACPDIRPGTYTLTLTANPDHTPTGAVSPLAGTSTGATTITNIVIVSGATLVDNDFGVQITPIDAIDNDYTATPINGGDGGTTPNILGNDTLNGAAVDPADITATLTGDGGLTGVSVNPDGTLSVPAGTPAGSYDVPYQICEVLNPANCDTAIATVLVNPPAIDAVDNDYTSTPINGGDGGTTPNILGNDTLNSAAVDPADITATLTGDGGLTGVALNPDGTLSVPAGTPAGSYDVPYQICEVLNPANCDTAIATVVINPPAIDAVDNDYTSTPINGANGGSTPNILLDDTLNGTVADPADITATLTGDGGLTGVVLNPDGTLSVPAGTAAGSYDVPYQICEVLNPANCDTAIATVLVNPPAIDAVDDDYAPTPINGVDGGNTPVITVNDTLNDAPVDPADITVTLTGDGGLTGVVLNPDGTLSVPADTPAGTYGVAYEICEVLNPANCDTAISTVVVTVTTSVSGIVYLDINGDGTHQPGEPLHSGYLVEVRVDGVIVGTAVTDENGFYSIEGLDPATNVDIVFIDPDTRTVMGGIQGLSLVAGANLVDQNLPLDPSGVVYDYATGDPIPGATVSLTDAGGALLPAACLLDASQQSQVTGTDGAYRFDLIPGADAACPIGETEYRIELTMPGGSPPIFGFPAESNPLDATTCPIDAIPGGRCQVFDQITAPQPGMSSIYFLSFLLAQGDSNVINNHIPIDLAAVAQPLTATKRVNTSRASVGTPLVYTITVHNNTGTDVTDTEIVDTMPTGFKYVDGSGRVDGLPAEPTITGNRLVWSHIDLIAGNEVTATLGAVVGAGARVGDYTNQAYGETGTGTVRLTNTAEATVRVTPDEIFDCSEVIGKVFEDTNGNGIQDEGEDGLPGVRIATVRGLLITTDEFGRYHIACASAPRIIGSNFIVKVDERTLPSGFSISTENPRVIRLTKGKMSEANFGAQMIRIVRMDLTSDAFVSGTSELKPEWQAKMADVMDLLAEQPSILKLTYVGDSGGGGRLDALTDQIRERWGDGPYELRIETNALSAANKEER